MKNLEEVLNTYLNSGNASDLPTISDPVLIRVNAIADGYRSLRRGGHLYAIVKKDNNYSIYAAHNSKYDAVMHHPAKPVEVKGFYLDDTPVVLSEDGNVFFDARDTRSSYTITRRVRKVSKVDTNILYSVLNAFAAYVYSTYRFSEAYELKAIPPIEIEDTSTGQTPPQPAPNPDQGQAPKSDSGTNETTSTTENK